jgi:hypothetical protein
VIETRGRGYAVADATTSGGGMDEQIGGTGSGITDERIRERAYEISIREDAGTPEENWRRAEQELRSGTGGGPSGGADAAPTAGDEPSEDLPGAASP